MDFLSQVRQALESRMGGQPGDSGKQTQDPDEKDLAAYVKGKLEDARQAPSRVAFESQFVTNTAYLLGFDGLQYDSRLKQFRSVAQPSGYPARSKAHANLVLPTVQNRLARLCKNPPRYDVLPNSNSQEDKDAARLSLKALNNKFDEEKVNEKRVELYMLMQQAGHSYIKTCWDPMRGRKMPVLDDFNQPTGEFEYEGDIAIEPIPPLEIFADPLAKSLRDAEWVIHAKVRKLSYFRNQYPDRGKEVKAEETWLISLQNLQRVNNMTNRGTYSTGTQEMKNAAIEIAYYEKPSKKFPGGRFIVVANGIILEYKDLPIDELPFAKFDDVKVGGKYNSESVISHLRSLQDQLNRNMRRKAEWLNKGLALKILAAKGHGLHMEAMNDATEVVEYNPVPNAAPPSPMPPAQLPQYVFTDVEQIESKFNEIAGINEVSKGQMPSASIPALGMQILQEADETRIGVITESNENSWSDVGRQVLKYMNAYYTNARYLKEAGQDNQYTVSEYTGRDLRDHTDVKVVRGSTLPNSKVLKRQEILNAYGQGLLGDPMDPNVKRNVLKYTEFGDVQGAWEDQVVDDAQIKRTIDQIEQGQAPEFHIDDNHAAHFDYKNRYRKTEKFLNLPPEVQGLFLQDLEAHKLAMQQAMIPPPMPIAPGAAPVGEELPPEEGQPPVDEGAILQ